MNDTTVTVIGVLSGVAVLGLVGWLAYEAYTAPFDQYDADDDLDVEALPSGFRPPYSGDRR